MIDDQIEEEVLTIRVNEAAKLSGLGASTIRRLVRAGEIPAARLGRAILIPRLRFLNLLRVNRIAA